MRLCIFPYIFLQALQINWDAASSSNSAKESVPWDSLYSTTKMISEEEAQR